jgi:hypothetical protein
LEGNGGHLSRPVFRGESVPHELCRGLRGLGYEIENHARGFEIKGVPASVIALFSKRHRQIDDEAAAKLAKGALVGNVKELRERIAHGNRRRKLKDSTVDRLRPTWSKEMQPAERAALANLPPASERSFGPNQVASNSRLKWRDGRDSNPRPSA